MTVYVDIVLIENLCMNYIILFATGFIIKTKLHHIRMIFSALIGGIYAILSYMQVIPFYSNMFVKRLINVLKNVDLDVCQYLVDNSPRLKSGDSRLNDHCLQEQV